MCWGWWRRYSGACAGDGGAGYRGVKMTTPQPHALQGNSNGPTPRVDMTLRRVGPDRSL